jgi:hypothetical protein
MSNSISLHEQEITEDMIPDDSSDREKFRALTHMGRDGYNNLSVQDRHTLWNKKNYESIREALIFSCIAARMCTGESRIHWKETILKKRKRLWRIFVQNLTRSLYVPMKSKRRMIFQLDRSKVRHRCLNSGAWTNSAAPGATWAGSRWHFSCAASSSNA